MIKIKALTNDKSGHKPRLLAAVIAFSLCSGWTNSPAHAATTTVPESETATGAVLSSYDVQYVYGTANGTVANQFSGQIVYNAGTANNTTLNNGSYQWVYNSGVVNDTGLYGTTQQSLADNSTANNTILHNSSEQNVYGNSAANYTTLNSQAKQYVGDIGTANNTTLYDSAKQYVLYNGSRANNTILNGSSIQGVYNSAVANDTQLNGTAQQVIYNTGTVNTTILNDSSKQIFYGNGTANTTTLNDGSYQWIYNSSIVNDTQLNHNAYQVLNDTSTANRTTLNGSSIQDVYNSSVVNDTQLNNQAKQYVHGNGTADRTTLNGSSVQVVYNSSVANDTRLNNQAKQYVYDLGTANNTTLYGSTMQLIDDSGIASGTELNDNATQVVYGNGTANSAVLNNSALQEVYGNGIANNTTLNSNTAQAVFQTGTAHDTVLRDGSLQQVYGDGKVYRTEVNDQAAMVVESGATAYDTTVNNGSLYLRQNAVLTNDNAAFGAAVKINSGGTLAVVENGAGVDGNVTMQGGTIAFMRQGASYANALTGLTLNAVDGYKTLTVNGGLNGGGQLAMSANITAGTSDRLIVTGNVSGSYQVGFTNDATAAADGSETVQDIIQPGGGTGVFSGRVEYGGYLYELKQDENGYWDLAGSGKISSSGSASFSTFSAGYLLSYAETTTLYQRLGDLRRGEASDAPWARVYGGRFSSGSDAQVSGYGMSYRGIQAGLDRKQDTSRGAVYTGGMLGYTSASQSYDVGSGSTGSTTLGFYRTFIDPKGHYIDLVIKYGWMKSGYKVLDTASVWVEGDMSTCGPVLSLEVGNRLYQDKASKEGWYLEPQAQLSLGRQSGGSFIASNGLSVDVDSYTSVLGRLGIIVGHEVKKGDQPVNAYGKVSYVKEFEGDIGFSLNGSPVKEKLGDSWWSYGAGVTAQLGNDSNLYLDATRTSGGKFKQSWQLNVGLRGQFG